MIVDTSAIVAITLDEPGSDALRQALESADESGMAAPNYVELCAVVHRRGKPEITRLVDRLLRAYAVEIVAFDAGQTAIAAQAYRDFGRGSGHPARLNLGDTYSYALARATDDTLLFVGDDFSHTDIRSALRDLR